MVANYLREIFHLGYNTPIVRVAELESVYIHSCAATGVCVLRVERMTYKGKEIHFAYCPACRKVIYSIEEEYGYGY